MANVDSAPVTAAQTPLPPASIAQSIPNDLTVNPTIPAGPPAQSKNQNFTKNIKKSPNPEEPPLAPADITVIPFRPSSSPPIMNSQQFPALTPDNPLSALTTAELLASTDTQDYIEPKMVTPPSTAVMSRPEPTPADQLLKESSLRSAMQEIADLGKNGKYPIPTVATANAENSPDRRRKIPGSNGTPQDIYTETPIDGSYPRDPVKNPATPEQKKRIKFTTKSPKPLVHVPQDTDNKKTPPTTTTQSTLSASKTKQNTLLSRLLSAARAIKASDKKISPDKPKLPKQNKKQSALQRVTARTFQAEATVLGTSMANYLSTNKKPSPDKKTHTTTQESKPNGAAGVLPPNTPLSQHKNIDKHTNVPLNHNTGSPRNTKKTTSANTFLTNLDEDIPRNTPPAPHDDDASRAGEEGWETATDPFRSDSDQDLPKGTDPFPDTDSEEEKEHRSDIPTALDLTNNAQLVESMSRLHEIANTTKTLHSKVAKVNRALRILPELSTFLHTTEVSQDSLPDFFSRAETARLALI